MSSTLTIEPSNRKKINLSSDLKFVLRRKNQERTSSKMIVDETDIPYFEGLRDAGIKDADVVISLIGKYGECVIDEQF